MHVNKGNNLLRDVLFLPTIAHHLSPVVNLHFYQPGVLDVHLPFPSQWNELLPTELEAISAVQLQEFKTPGQDRATLLCKLLAIRQKHHGIHLPKDYFGRVSIEDWSTSGSDVLNFVFEGNDRTVQPYPFLRVPTYARRFTGPADDFNNLTCGEYEDCEIFFNQFKAEPGPEPLARLAAVLYRPAGQRYIQYDAATATYKPYEIESKLKYFLRIHPEVLFTIFTWYAGCRSQLPKYFPTAFKGGGAAGDEPDFIAFTKCIHGAAGPKNGTRDAIRCTGIKEFLLELELEAQKAEEMKQKMEDLKRRA